MTLNLSNGTMHMMDEELDSIKKLYRAFNDRNPDLLDEACSADWQDIPLARGQGPGTCGFKKMMPLFFTAFPDFKIEVQEIFASP